MDTKRYLQDCIKSIAESVRFDSSQAAPLPGMPFGKGAADCLAHFLRLAESMGFETHNYDNYVGEAVWGEGEAFAILAHLDVVPAGDGWTHPPFAGEIADGKLYGRGTMDDKGPAIVCLYCLKALKDAGFAPRRTIRLIVGCNEENGWECIAHYNRVARMPESGFSPDADFPVIYAEKGILHVCLRFALPDAPFSALYGGERANMVCDRAMAEGGPFDAARAKKYGLTAEDGKLVAEGKIRGRKQSLIALVDNMEKKLGNYQNDVVFISHGDSEEDALFVKELVQKRFGINEFILGNISPIIGAHSGPGTVALFFMGEIR